MATYYVPAINIMGTGSLKELESAISDLGFNKAFVVTDKILVNNGIVEKVTDLLEKANLSFSIFDEVMPNPTSTIINQGFEKLKKEGCDFVVSIGGGSPQDAAKAIALLATNGGDIKTYEGVHMTSKRSLPIVAVNTTAGTSSEVTINYVITDEDRQVKMVMVDKNCLATITVNDPELMVEKPADLTAATGMDALTHAIECIVTPGAYAVTDATALSAVKIIFDYLPRAVKNGYDIEAREQMVYAIFLAGIAFSNAGLGYVHAMAHQLGGVYDLPHGVCNAMLLPHVQVENAKAVPEKFIAIAKVLDYDVAEKSADECATYVIDRMLSLSKEVGIPTKLSELGVTDIDFNLLTENAMKDICAPGNPVAFTREQIKALFQEIA